jgi:hypothetical protein
MSRGQSNIELILFIAMGAVMVMMIGLVSLSIAQGTIESNAELLTSILNNSNS